MIFRNEKLPEGSVLVRLYKAESSEEWPIDYFSTAVIVPVDLVTCEVKGLVLDDNRTYEDNRDIAETINNACRLAGFTKMKYHRRKHGRDYTATIRL